MTDLSKAKTIMGNNFIGPKELEKIARLLGIGLPQKVPEIPFSEARLKKFKESYILILVPKGVSLIKMREKLGIDPNKREPCFYNQDWYEKEDFAKKKILELRWYLVAKRIKEETRGQTPDKIKEQLPRAASAAFTFFAYYFQNKEALWKKDFIWCSDFDSNGDQIYVGHYIDPKGKNKNGFEIHRHLKIRFCYGAAPQIA